MKLFHISEDGSSEKFVPRPSKKMWGYKAYVWAISEEKVHNYLFPRACPRICVGNGNLELLSDFMDLVEIKDRKALIFVPNNWKEKIENSLLYQYEFNPANFREIDTIAGYYVSEQIEIPLQKIILKNTLPLLDEMQIEVIFKDSNTLKEICQRVIENFTEFSIIKWQNL